MVAAGAEAETSYMVEPEIWVPVTQSFCGKRVNLLWDERCLPYVYIISFFSWPSEGVHGGLGAPGF